LIPTSAGRKRRKNLEVGVGGVYQSIYICIILGLDLICMYHSVIFIIFVYKERKGRDCKEREREEMRRMWSIDVPQ